MGGECIARDGVREAQIGGWNLFSFAAPLLKGTVYSRWDDFFGRELVLNGGCGRAACRWASARALSGW